MQMYAYFSPLHINVLIIWDNKKWLAPRKNVGYKWCHLKLDLDFMLHESMNWTFIQIFGGHMTPLTLYDQLCHIGNTYF